MKAKELAEELMKNPELEVGIRSNSNNAWPVVDAFVEDFDDTCDSILLVENRKSGKFIVIEG